MPSGQRSIMLLLVLGLAATLAARGQVERPRDVRDDMVFLPDARFVMGTDATEVDALMVRFHVKRRELFLSELPAHTVAVRGFFLDRTEVTNAAFKRFVASHPEWARDRVPPDRHNGEYLKTWHGRTYPAGEADLPVTFITWDAASAYCEAMGRRLPTEAEWERAADGARGAEFPWGEADPDPSRANFSGTGLGKPAPVGSFPPTDGLYDMAGNVWEFVDDRWHDSYSGSATVSADRRVIRGGSFGAAPVNLRVRYRDSHPQLGAGPHVGVRCARSMEVF